MSKYDDGAAHEQAIALVSKALESGSIRLGGPTTMHQSSSAGERDAEYLASLIKVLSHRLAE